ncbi:hypothetical protein A8G00_11230 [Sphingobium sp. SA916]|nr:hypothetical protein A8G00_11230 [Sphingobium sp. SA916]
MSARQFSRIAPGIFVLSLASAAMARDGAGPLILPFDFSKSAVEIDVTVKSTPLHMILDTGVDPSVIDLAETERLGLEVQRGEGGEASGFGDGKGESVFPTKIDGLAIAGHGFGRFEALATDMREISADLGRKLDGVLGYSFLADKMVLIDYPAQKAAILERAGDAVS